MILQKRLSDLKANIARGDIWEDKIGALHLVISNDVLLANAPFVFTLRVVKSGIATRIVPYSLKRINRADLIARHSSLSNYEVESCIQEFMMYVSGFTTFNNVEIYDGNVDMGLQAGKDYEDPNPVMSDPLVEYIDKARERLEKQSMFGYSIHPAHENIVEENTKSFIDDMYKERREWYNNPFPYKPNHFFNTTLNKESNVQDAAEVKTEHTTATATKVAEPEEEPIIETQVEQVGEEQPESDVKPKRKYITRKNKDFFDVLANKIAENTKKTDDTEETAQQLSLNLEQPKEEPVVEPPVKPEPEEVKAPVVINSAEDIIGLEGFGDMVESFVNKEITKATLKDTLGVTNDKLLDDAIVMEMSKIHPWRYGQNKGVLFVKGSKRDPHASRRWINLNDKQRGIIIKSFADYDELRIREGAEVLGLSYDELMDIITSPKTPSTKKFPEEETRCKKLMANNNISNDWKAFVEDFKSYDFDSKKRIAKMINGIKPDVLAEYFSVHASTIYNWKAKYKTLL